jgi:hypothetical protein
MGNTASYVSTGKPKTGGAVYRAPLGSTLPTDHKAELDKAFICLGYVSDAGLTNNIARTYGSIKDWGGTTVATPQTEFADTFGLTLIESLNPDVLKTVHGSAAVTGDLDTGLTVNVSDTEPEAGAWVVDMITLGGYAKRIVIPEAKLTGLGEIAYTGTDAIGYQLTLTATPDSTGKTHTEYIGK